MNLAFKTGLWAAGFSETEIEAIDAAIPAAERLDDAMTEMDPIIRKIWPDVLKLAVIVQREYPDGIAVLPVVRRLLQIAKGT